MTPIYAACMGLIAGFAIHAAIRSSWRECAIQTAFFLALALGASL